MYHKILKSLISQMLHHQQINNTKSQCVFNSKFLYDFFRVNFNIKLNIIVGFVVGRKSCGNYKLCTHVWIEYNNVQYEPSFEWTNSVCRFNTIFEFLNSKIWKTIKIDVNEYNQRCGIKELMLDWEIHNKQVNIIQNTNKKCWTPASKTSI
jgi:hypothetical protein